MKLRLTLAAAILTLASVLHAEDPATFEVGALKFQRPAAWQWVAVSSPMRKAQLKVPGADASKAADITFFHFGPGQGGGVQENAQRWLKQFKSAEAAEKIEPLETPGAKVTLVSTEGSFTSGMPGGPADVKEGYALLGAIVEDAEGAVFVKMTGPAATVKGARKPFIDFITAAAKK